MQSVPDCHQALIQRVDLRWVATGSWQCFQRKSLEKVSKKSITKRNHQESPPVYPAFLMLYDIISAVCDALGLSLGAVIMSPKQAYMFHGTCKHFVSVFIFFCWSSMKRKYIYHV